MCVCVCGGGGGGGGRIESVLPGHMNLQNPGLFKVKPSLTLQQHSRKMFLRNLKIALCKICSAVR